MIRISSSLALAIGLLTAPAGQPGRTPGNFESITLERTICYGTCPAYRVQVFDDGRVEYEGRRFVKVIGKRAKRLTSAQMDALRAELAKCRYFELRDRYQYRQDGCPETWTDNPSAITSVKAGIRTKSIEHDYGCRRNDTGEPYPAELTRFENRIDEILHTKEWVGKAR